MDLYSHDLGLDSATSLTVNAIPSQDNCQSLRQLAARADVARQLVFTPESLSV